MAPDPVGYLFLDIDGILNPEAYALPGDWTTMPFGPYRVWISQRLGDWLQRLASHGVQIVWATTWIEIPDDLADLAVALGLPRDLPRIDRIEWPDGDGGAECGKRPAVQRWLEENGIDPRVTPVAWVDDCLGPADQRHARAVGIRAIKVPPRLGLADPGQRIRIERALGVEPDRSGSVGAA